MPYEVFISFKRGKPDGSGTTRDFALAAELHRELTAKGIKVFFSERDLSSSATEGVNFTKLWTVICDLLH